jgi:hypothetical protein
MQKNVAGQRIAVKAFDASNGQPKIDDAGNITIYVSIDGAAPAALNNNTVTQLNNVTAKGDYVALVAQAETNGDLLVFSGRSTTNNVFIDSTLIYSRPANFPATSIDSNGVVKSNIAQVLGTAATAATAGILDVNTKNIGNNVVNNATAVLGVNVVNIAGAASVGAPGHVGIDWNKVANNGSAMVLSSTTVGNVAGSVGTVSGNVNGNIAGNVLGTVASVVGNVAGVTGNVGGNVAGSVGTVAGNVNGNVLGSVTSVTGFNAALVDAKISTRTVPGDNMNLTAGERLLVADAFLDRDMATGADSGSGTVRTVRQSLRMLRNKWVANNNALIVYKEDDATESWNTALTSDAAAVPITGSDPA